MERTKLTLDQLLYITNAAIRDFSEFNINMELTTDELEKVLNNEGELNVKHGNWRIVFDHNLDGTFNLQQFEWSSGNVEGECEWYWTEEDIDDVITDWSRNRKVKNTLAILVESAVKRNKQLDNMLFYGEEPDEAEKIAFSLALDYDQSRGNPQGKIWNKDGSYLNSPNDVVCVFASLAKGDVLIINKFEQIENQEAKNVITSIIANNYIDIEVGSPTNPKIVRTTFPEHTILVTTDLVTSKSMNPYLRDNFGLTAKIEPLKRKLSRSR